jgi:hypothetical protein
VDRIIHHLVPVLAHTLRPAPDTSNHPWIIDATLIPVHRQSITAISNNYRRSLNTQIIICAHRRRVAQAGQCWPANRNDVIVARHTVAHLLDGRIVLGDRGYRAITSITTGHAAASEPASSTSSPGSRTPRYCGNAAAAATQSTTASTSSPDPGTSKPSINYGSPS